LAQEAASELQQFFLSALAAQHEASAFALHAQAPAGHSQEAAQAALPQSEPQVQASAQAQASAAQVQEPESAHLHASASVSAKLGLATKVMAAAAVRNSKMVNIEVFFNMIYFPLRVVFFRITNQ
jgi:hypothetical protein